MTVDELLGLLEEYRNSDAEVRLAMQPRWAFEYSIDRVEEVMDDEENITLYLSEGEQIGYLPEGAAQVLGW